MQTNKKMFLECQIKKMLLTMAFIKHSPENFLTNRLNEKKKFVLKLFFRNQNVLFKEILA